MKLTRSVFSILLTGVLVLICAACLPDHGATTSGPAVGTYLCSPAGSANPDTVAGMITTILPAQEGCWGLHTGVVGYSLDTQKNDWMSGLCSGVVQATQSGCAADKWAPSHDYTEHIVSAEAGNDPNVTSTVSGNVFLMSDGAHLGSPTGTLLANSGITNGYPYLWHTLLHGCISVKTDNASIMDVLIADGPHANDCSGGTTATAHADISVGNGDVGTARNLDASYNTLDGSEGTPAGVEGAGEPGSPDNHGFIGSGFTLDHNDIYGYGKSVFLLYSAVSDPTVIQDNYMHDLDYASFITCNHADNIFLWGSTNVTIRHNFIKSLNAAGEAVANANPSGCTSGVGVSGAVFFNSGSVTPSNIVVDGNYLLAQTGKDISQGSAWALPITETNNALDPGAWFICNLGNGGTTWSGNFNAVTLAAIPTQPC